MKTIKYNNIGKHIAFGFLAISLLTACNNTESGKHEHDGHEAHGEESSGLIELTAAQIKEAGISTGTFQYKSISDGINCNGFIELPPNNIASISVPMEGFVEDIRFLEGAKVKKGDILVELKHPSYVQLQQDYMQALSRYGYLEKELERQKTLSDANVSAKKTYQQTQADYSSVKSEVSALKEKLGFLGISPKKVESGNIQSIVYLTAPFTGTVTQLNAHKGQLVDPSKVIMEVIDTKHMHVELKVFQKNIPQIKEEMPIEFAVPAYENNIIYEGKVALVGKNLDTETKTIRVHGHFEERPELIPGLYVEAKILQTAKQQRVLPEGAIFRDEGNWYFFVKKEEEASGHVAFEKIKFTPGITSNGYTQVIDFDSTADTMAIVTQKVFYLKSEMNKSKGGHED